MGMDEFWASFPYMLPLLSERTLLKLGVARETLARLKNFREVATKKLLEQRDAEKEAAKKAGVASLLVARHAEGVLERRYRNEILLDPVAHLRVTLLLAAMRNFPEKGFGDLHWRRRTRLADAWGISWPKFGYKFGRSETTWFNAAATLSIVALPFVMWRRRRGLAGLVVLLPLYYSHALYAAVSHFPMRYASPEIPLRNVALSAVVFVAAVALWRQAQRLRQSEAIREFSPSLRPVTDKTLSG